MTSRPWRPFTATLAAALLALAAPLAHAGRDGERDQDRAREAVRAGQAMPLDALRERLRRSHPGELLDAELEREDGRWVYELRLLQPEGRIVKLEVDARSGQVLRERADRRRR